MVSSKFCQEETRITYFLRAGDDHQWVNDIFSNETKDLQSECRDGHKKVHREFIIKKQSECYMHIGTDYLQTTMIHSAICLNAIV